MELIYYLIFLDRDKTDVYWDKTSCFLHNPLDQSKDAPNDELSSPRSPVALRLNISERTEISYIAIRDFKQPSQWGWDESWAGR